MPNEEEKPKEEIPEEEKPLIPLEPYSPPKEERVSIQHSHRGTDTPRVSYNDLLNNPTIITDHGELLGLADDDHIQYVKDTGDETVAGVKTFSSFPITPSSAPTTNYQTANKKYVDDNIFSYAAGDVLIQSADTERTGSEASMTKKKEIQIATSGTLRIKFDLAQVTAGLDVEYGRIYVNGVVKGTLRDITNTTTYQTFTEDISGLVKGDLVQLYCYRYGSTNDYKIRNFRFYASIPEIATVILDLNLD